jgi:hypothetical protein
MDACRDILSAAKRVILAVDNDGPGSALAVELSRRYAGARRKGCSTLSTCVVHTQAI